ncbi:hypothetical protein [Companilactobacillus paralimentarius]|uniref:hypothetical protein n=1 Tax=Companilactobacillus paralimentarius TaxID=83526 RepID=UPI00186BA278|nr:hypothetical protein [Companilactobacillus paralimentarius]
MNKKRFIFSAAMAMILVVFSFFTYSCHAQAVNSKKYVQESIPTIFSMVMEVVIELKLK